MPSADITLEIYRVISLKIVREKWDSLRSRRILCCTTAFRYYGVCQSMKKNFLAGGTVCAVPATTCHVSTLLTKVLNSIPETRKSRFVKSLIGATRAQKDFAGIN